jgi:hypothetical protein
MIIFGLDTSKSPIPFLLNADGSPVVSPDLLTSSGLAIALDASQRVKVLLDAVTGNVPVNIAASGINVPVNLAASAITLNTSEQTPIYQNITGVRGVLNQTALAAGTSTEYAPAVTASQRWRLTNYAVRYVGTVAGVTLKMLTYDGSAPRYFAQHNGLTSNLFYFNHVNIVLEAGWQIGCEVIGATANDDLRFDLHYERIK